MTDAPQSYTLNLEERDRIEAELKTLYKERVLLQQSVREQQTQAAAATEDLFLELLEVGDALQSLLDYLTNNPEPSPEFIQRLPRSMGAVQRKFLSVLAKRQVLPIQLEGTQPDFNLCRVVDREVRADLPERTITKVLRQGFYLGKKILRPTEVITSKSDVME
jgi:molecular chaperone GrpE